MMTNIQRFFNIIRLSASIGAKTSSNKDDVMFSLNNIKDHLYLLESEMGLKKKKGKHIIMKPPQNELTCSK